MIRNVTEAGMASPEELKAFLKAENIPFNENANKPELLQQVREFITQRNAKKDVKEAEDKAKEEVDAVKTPEDALRLLQAKGFKDVEEVKAYIGVIVREGETARKEKEALQATLDDIQKREFAMDDREKAVVKQAADVRADMAKQEEVYEKLHKLREQMRAEGTLANANV